MHITASIRTLAVTAAILLPATMASAAVTSLGTWTTDAAFEGPGGFLNSPPYNLPLVGGTALPPIERAVGQIRMSGDRRALHLPTAVTGIPVADGGTGVTQALTNVSPFAAAGTDFANATPVSFSVGRVGNVVTYTVGANSFISNSRLSLGEINSFELRIRTSTPNTGNPFNSLAITDLVFNDSITTNQALTGLSAQDGQVIIGLWDGIVGDFTLSGNYTVSWTGTRPSGSALASQLKLLDFPSAPPIPEPATWAMLIAGFGLVGANMRRRRLLAA